MPPSLNPKAKGLWSIFNLVIFKTQKEKLVSVFVRITRPPCRLGVSCQYLWIEVSGHGGEGGLWEGEGLVGAPVAVCLGDVEPGAVAVH